jgi:hypothetical protein
VAIFSFFFPELVRTCMPCQCEAYGYGHSAE